MKNEKPGNVPSSPMEFNFESMNLQVATRFQFFLHRDAKPVQYFSTLIGYVKDEYLLVKIPFENGAAVSLREGEKLTVRIFSGVNVCSFDCTVMRVFLHPFFYVHLTFPTLIQGTSLRMAMRVKVRIPARLCTTANAAESAARTVLLTNLSVGGALIECGQDLGRTPDTVFLSFKLASHQGEQEVLVNTRMAIRNASVRKASADEPNDTYTYGVQFVELDPAHQVMLQNLTYEALIGDRQRLV